MTWILLVDDDRDVVRALTRLIGLRTPTPVHGVRGAWEARQALHGERGAPAAAILDHELRDPHGDGLTVLTDLRRRWPHVPCAFYTATPGTELTPRLAALGMDPPVALFHKPEPLGPLLDWVQAVLGAPSR